MYTYKQSLDKISVSEEKSQEIIDNITLRLSDSSTKRTNSKKYISLCVLTATIIIISVLGIKSPSNTMNTLPITSENNNTTVQEPIAYNWNKSTAKAEPTMYRDPNCTTQNITFEEFCQDIGYNPKPKYTPKNYKEWIPKESTFYINPDGTLSDYHSYFEFGYENDKNYIGIRISKSKIYANDDISEENVYSETNFGDFNAILKKTDFSEQKERNPNFDSSHLVSFSAKFTHNNINYYVYAKGDVQESEFIKVIQSLNFEK